MDLLFPKYYTQSRWRFTRKELKHICRNSEGLVFNNELFEENKEFEFFRRAITMGSEQHAKFMNDDDTFLESGLYPRATIISGRSSFNTYEIFSKACDISCSICNRTQYEKDIPGRVRPMEGIVCIEFGNYDRVEPLCYDCRKKLFKNINIRFNNNYDSFYPEYKDLLLVNFIRMLSNTKQHKEET